jgi:hypothetical protein
MNPLNIMLNYEIKPDQTTNFKIDGDNSTKELAHAAARPLVGLMQIASGLVNVVEGLVNYPSEYSSPVEEDGKKLLQEGGKDLLKGAINLALGPITAPIVVVKAIEHIAKNTIQKT